jgi:hypothetical protein
MAGEPFRKGVARMPIGVRHASGDRIVAMIEIVSPGNKSSRHAFQALYECDLTTRAYIEPLAVGQPLPDMPLCLEPNGCVMVPLEATYQAAFAVMPRRWRTVLEPPPLP